MIIITNPHFSQNRVSRDSLPTQWSKLGAAFSKQISGYFRVSVQGVESLWGDCKFIPADWGS